MSNEGKPTRPQTRYGIDLIAGVVIFAVSIYVMIKSITFWKEDFVDVFFYSAGLMPMIAQFFTIIFEIIMNSAAGTPFPETSAMTRPR